jgi:hypothetical protein
MSTRKSQPPTLAVVLAPAASPTLAAPSTPSTHAPTTEVSS